MPSAVSQRSSPSTLTTMESITITATLVTTKSRIRFMRFLLLIGLLDRDRARWFQDGPRALLCNDVSRGIGVPRRDAREHRSVDHAQAADAAHSQLIVDHRQRIVAHLTGPDRMENGRSELARGSRQFIGVRNGCPGPVLLG